MKDLNQKCSGRKKSGAIGFIFVFGSSSLKCYNNAKYFEGNKWYCGKHAPSKIAQREEKSFAKMQQKIRTK